MHDIAGDKVTSRRLPGFALVGAVGFLVDASILTVLMTGFDFGPYAARAISFTAAVTTTWYLNRRWVFDRQAVPLSGREYLSYVTVQVIGATINLLVFVAVIELVESLRNMPVVPLAIGAGVALLFNYGASSRFVFADRHGTGTEESPQ